MISANPKYTTENDIEEVLKLNPKEEDLQSSFVTDGKFLYYVDGVTNPQEIRALSEEEQDEINMEFMRVKTIELLASDIFKP